MVRDIKYFLMEIGMMKYHKIFHAKGFDLESDIQNITLLDLEKNLMISSVKEQAYILYKGEFFSISQCIRKVTHLK